MPSMRAIRYLPRNIQYSPLMSINMSILPSFRYVIKILEDGFPPTNVNVYEW